MKMFKTFEVADRFNIQTTDEYQYMIITHKSFYRNVGDDLKFDCNVRICDLWELYKINNHKRIEILKKYNALISKDEVLFICFKTHADAQKFIDEFLIPHEIAFNLNGK